MATQPGDNTPRRWVPVDQLLSAIDEREATTLRPRPRPVAPADDDECYRLNPPEECSGSVRTAGLHGAFYRGRGART
jgi:hypothetical protein